MTFRFFPTASIMAAAVALSVPAHSQEAGAEAEAEAEPEPEVIEGTEKLSLTQQTALRCSAGFAIISGFQDEGQALEYPILRDRGREFFVRIAARIMENTGIDRDGISQVMAREVKGFEDKEELKAAMPACLLLLEASGV